MRISHRRKIGKIEFFHSLMVGGDQFGDRIHRVVFLSQVNVHKLGYAISAGKIRVIRYTHIRNTAAVYLNEPSELRLQFTICSAFCVGIRWEYKVFFS